MIREEARNSWQRQYQGISEDSDRSKQFKPLSSRSVLKYYIRLTSQASTELPYSA